MKKKFNILLLIDIVAIFATIFVRNSYGKTPIDQIIFHLQVPIEGTSTDLLPIIIFNCILVPLILFIVIILLSIIINKLIKNRKITKTIRNKEYTFLPINLTSRGFKMICILGLIVIIIDNLIFYDVFNFVKNTFTKSDFIEQNYVDPNSVLIKFNNKKNLIYIFVESLEETYTSDDLGGGFEYNLIPNLTDLAFNNTTFGKNKIGGLYGLNNTGWTSAGLMAQTSGLPAKISTSGKLYKDDDTFLNNAVTLGDILEQEGYNQTFMIGSRATFGGRKAYFKNHGNFEIWDYDFAKENNYIDPDYYEFWGFEDSKLFEFAKDKLSQLSKDNKPFNLTLLTVNTHTPDGYLEKTCDDIYEKRIENVIACTDRQLNDFINWIKDQAFYNDTVIVITGDHLNMDSTFIKSNNRYVYNVIINGNESNNKKEASVFDMFPTVLSALGASIEGNRLGLGVNLYSDEQTLIEKYGTDYVNNEISKKSDFYDKLFLFD